MGNNRMLNKYKEWY